MYAYIILFECRLVLNKHSFQIGINYFGQDAELRGCINDANNMQNFLCSEQELGFIIRLIYLLLCPKPTMDTKKKTL